MGRHRRGSKSDQRNLERLPAPKANWWRVYRNPAGNEVRVSIISLASAHSYHTPDRCYPAAGFEMQGEPQQEVFEVGNTTAEFFMTSFLKSEATGVHSENRGFWSWSADGTWTAPKNYKMKFAGQKALDKLYVFASTPPGNKRSPGGEFYNDFIRAFRSGVRSRAASRRRESRPRRPQAANRRHHRASEAEAA